jgi:Micrococcal nuclease (thermonuclease) homologs
MNAIQPNPPGEGLNRVGATVTDDGGTRFVHATSCDVFRDLTETREASGPVRFRVELSRIVDGDTIRVIWHGENLPVRFLGISAPERHHPGGTESTERLRALLSEADTVDLEFEGDTPRRDSLGRLLAYVWRGDVLLNLEMVKHGHAGLYKNGGKGKHGDALRDAAREQSER